MYEVGITTHFSAAHHLVGYDGSCAGKHGHNWGVEVFVEGEELDGTGILVDFRKLKRDVQQVLADMDHTDLNEAEFFKESNPTSENIARLLYGRLASRINCETYRLSRVLVRETPGNGARYSE